MRRFPLPGDVEKLAARDNGDSAGAVDDQPISSIRFCRRRAVAAMIFSRYASYRRRLLVSADIIRYSANSQQLA